jgi:hypothetical protein
LPAIPYGIPSVIGGVWRNGHSALASLRTRFLLLALIAIALTIISSNAYAQTSQTGNVIYGNSVGLPADATIQSVTFTQQGDNLVTTFQVEGTISTAYGYTIGIRASEATPNDQLSDYIISYSYTVVGPGPYFLVGKTNTATPIVDSTVIGGTWTASVPLSWINDLTDFWVETSVVQTVSWGVQLIDSAPHTSFGQHSYVEIILPSSAYTTSSYMLFTSTSATSSLQMTQAPQSTSQVTNNMTLVELVVAAIIVICVLASYLFYSRRPKSKQTKLDSIVSQSSAQLGPRMSTMFCNQCGAKITSDSKFCKECGAGQIQ